jgi:hypothetical protein
LKTEYFNVDSRITRMKSKVATPLKSRKFETEKSEPRITSPKIALGF